jgi:two-component system sensor histidine kinase RpfC
MGAGNRMAQSYGHAASGPGAAEPRATLLQRLRPSRIFADRPDTEHEMVMNRLVIGALILIYLLITKMWDREGALMPFLTVMFYVLGSIGILAHILRHPGASPARRIVAMAMDLGTLSFGLYVGGAITALLYPIYLWVIFGNGFRFGIPYLFTAAGMSVAGFGAVAFTADYWSGHTLLATGLLIGLVVIPGYAATLIAKLSRAKREAEEASRQKSLFLASVSHELRTPLNAIIGLSDLLKDTRLDANQHAMADTIQSAGTSLLEHINDILDYSRLEAGQMPSEKTDFNLHHSLREAVAMVSAQAGLKGVRVAYAIASDVPAMVHGERRQLQEILVNLAGNAVKFTQEGHVLLRAELLADDETGITLEVAVTDSGIGIAPEACERIFESFTQADETIINSFGGTGLGLAIVRQLVMLNGGEISVDSTLGKGSTFRFSLRLMHALEAHVTADATSHEPAPAPILISKAADATALIHRFAKAGHLPRLVGDAHAARALITGDKAHDGGPALLVIDSEGVEGDPRAIRRDVAAIDGLHDRSTILVSAQAPSDEACMSFATWLPRDADEVRMRNALRIAAMPYQRMSRSGATEAPKGGVKLPMLKVLIAEDNTTNQKVIAKILERAGHEYVLVGDGRAALQAMLDPGQGPFDLVLMDVNMPEMNGIEATRHYCASLPVDKRIPVIALTADATPEGRSACRAAGMAACATKPILPQHLFSVIADVLDAERSFAGRDGAMAPVGPPVEAASMAIDPAPEGPQAACNADTDTGRQAVIDPETFSRLGQLGGDSFRREVAESFLADAKDIIAEIEQAVATGDAEIVRDLLHAMRSSAANVGAVRIFELCLSLRDIDEATLAREGAAQLAALRRRYEEAHDALVELSHAA